MLTFSFVHWKRNLSLADHGHFIRAAMASRKSLAVAADAAAQRESHS